MLQDGCRVQVRPAPRMPFPLKLSNAQAPNFRSCKSPPASDSYAVEQDMGEKRGGSRVAAPRCALLPDAEAAPTRHTRRYFIEHRRENWVCIADDDQYVSVPNLRAFLARQEPLLARSPNRSVVRAWVAAIPFVQELALGIFGMEQMLSP